MHADPNTHTRTPKNRTHSCTKCGNVCRFSTIVYIHVLGCECMHVLWTHRAFECMLTVWLDKHETNDKNDGKEKKKKKQPVGETTLTLMEYTICIYSREEEKNTIERKPNKIHCTMVQWFNICCIDAINVNAAWCCCCVVAGWFDVVAIYFIHAPINCNTFAFSICSERFSLLCRSGWLARFFHNSFSSSSSWCLFSCIVLRAIPSWDMKMLLFMPLFRLFVFVGSKAIHLFTFIQHVYLSSVSISWCHTVKKVSDYCGGGWWCCCGGWRFRDT